MIKSAKLKLHNVSKRKRSVLLKAFKNYHLLCSALLDKTKADLEGFEKACTFTNNKGVSKLSPRSGYGFFKQHKSIRDSFQLPGNLKAAAINDVSRMMCAYFASGVAEKQPPSLPHWEVKDRTIEFEAALDEFYCCDDLITENRLKDSVAREPAGVRPLPLMFGNINDPNNPGVTIALHRPSNTYRAIIYVDNVDNTAKKPKFSITAEHQLYSIKDATQIIIKSARSAIIVPLEMGFFHVEEYLKKGVPKEGKLSYRPDSDEFYLHLAFEFKPEKIEPTTLMGVDRGITNICAYCVVDSQYKVITQGNCEGQTLMEYLSKEDEYKVTRQKNGHKYTGNRKRNFADRVIHLATNEVVLKAQVHKSQVFVEDLTSLVDKNKGKKERGKRGTKGRLSGLGYTLSKAQYTKFLQVLTYKLEAAGLPAPKSVHAAWTSTTCPECGNVDKLNRVSQALFRCTACTHEVNADLNAGRLIAMKGVWHWLPKVDKKKIKGEYKGDEYAGLWSNFIASVTSK